MKTLAILTFLALATSGNAMAAPTQQDKMRTCNAEAKTKALKGDERRAFMSQCLTLTPEEKQARLALKEKTKACSDEAKTKSLRGDARKEFIAQCSAA